MSVNVHGVGNNTLCITKHTVFLIKYRVGVIITEKKKEDRRTSYTKKMIREALYELMQTKPINKITVKEICETADVNRSTFYSYYLDIYDLHQKILKEFFSKQREVINHTTAFLAEKKDITSLEISDFYEIAFFYVSVVQQNREMYKFIFNQNSTSSSAISFNNLFFRTIDETLPDSIHDIFRRSFVFVSGGTTNLLTEWLKNNCAESAESIARSLAYYYNGVFNGQIMAGKSRSGL